MTGSLNLESAPHDLSVTATGKIMKILMITLIPAIIANVYFYGYGVVVNILLSVFSCLVAEGIVLKLRKRHINLLWRDSSAMVTGVILGLTLPQLLPWYLTVIGSVFAIVVVKQVFGGLGQNVFNPAMAGFVFLLISSPVAMTTYVIPVPGNHEALTLSRATAIIFTNSQDAKKEAMDSVDELVAKDRSLRAHDALTGPTFLTDAMHERPSKNSPNNNIKEFTEKSQGPAGYWLFLSHEITSLMFLLGGIVLIIFKVIDWRIPLAFLATLGVAGGIFWFCAPEAFLSPVTHYIFGATVFGAFYILTDPVTAVSKPQGAFIFGITAAVLFIIIRNLGGYPDAMAFSVILSNAAAPLISILTHRRPFGAGSKPEDLHND